MKCQGAPAESSKALHLRFSLSASPVHRNEPVVGMSHMHVRLQPEDVCETSQKSKPTSPSQLQEKAVPALFLCCLFFLVVSSSFLLGVYYCPTSAGKDERLKVLGGRHKICQTLFFLKEFSWELGRAHDPESKGLGSKVPAAC